jgi:tetratricopeptide (TPR) repeat protein
MKTQLTEAICLCSYNEALSHINKGRISDALGCLEHALGAGIYDITVLNVKGLCHYILGEFEQAANAWILSLTLELSSKFEYNASSNQNPASVYLETMKSLEFIEFVKGYNSSIRFITDGKYIKAMNILKHLKRKYPIFTSLYNLSGLLYMERGFVKKARKQWQKALGLDCSNTEALNYMKATERI